MPHGGSLRPLEMNHRLQGCYDADADECNFDSSVVNCDRKERKCRIVAHSDLGTQPIARVMADTIQKELGIKPHVVMLHTHR